MKRLILPVVFLLAGIAFILLHFLSGNPEDSLKLEIKMSKVLMPAAYKVYANPDALDGKYYLFKMLVTNEGAKPIDNITVTYSVPKFLEWTELQEIKRLNPGQSAVVCCYPAFDDKIIDKTTSSKERVILKLKSGSLEKTEEYSFEMKGRNDFVYTSIPNQEIRTYADMSDNDALLGCFVTPEDPIVKYYTQQIQEKLLKGETASVSREPREAVRFLMGIYEATLRSHMVYSGTKGIPGSFEDVQSIVQHLRLPREVITGNTGLCIELSLMYASILANEGLSPVIYLIPGHAYPGFRMNGEYYAIEATAIGGEGLGSIATPEQAFEAGMKELTEFMKAARAGDDRYTILDINEITKKGVLPMELRDDTFLRQKIDELARNFGGGAPGRRQEPVYVADNPAPRTPDGSGVARYAGNVSFSYPSNWLRINMPNPNMPFLVSQINAPDNTASVEVYEFAGYSSPDIALSDLARHFANYGVNLQYQKTGQQGNGVQQYSGVSISGAANYRWVAIFRATGTGVSGLAVGSPSSYFQQNQAILSNILSTVN